MRIICLLIIVLSNFCFAQRTKKEILNDPQNDCIKNKNVSFNKLSKIFPLNQSYKIQIVSFEYKEIVDLTNSDSNNVIVNKSQTSTPITNNKLDIEKFKEIKVLNFNQVIELSDILFNYGINPKSRIATKDTKCYEPRNAIIFFNENDEVIECFEICFSCNKFEIYNNSKFGEFCEGKLELLKTFFLNNGIKFGPNFRY